MKRATPILFLFLVIAWVAGPFLYRASWALTGAPVAARTTFPLPKVTPEKVRAFHLDTTRSTPPERSPHPARPFVPKPEAYRKCKPPRPEAGDRLIVLGVGRGEAMSTVGLANDRTSTSVVDVIVEPGAQPLYLVLSASDITIWRFTGATGRIARVVLMASPSVPPPLDPNIINDMPPRQYFPFAGVTGLPSERVTTLEPGDCFRSTAYPNEDRMQSTAASAKRVFGRDAVVMAGGDKVSAVRVPSGLAATMRTPSEARQQRAAPAAAVPAPGRENGDPLVEWPGGLVDIRPGEVVSTVSATREVLLPGDMGMAQLIEAGEVELAQASRSVEYRIRRPIVRLPSGLSWWHTVVLEPGVPAPADADGVCLRRRAVVGLSFSYRISRAACPE